MPFGTASTPIPSGSMHDVVAVEGDAGPGGDPKRPLLDGDGISAADDPPPGVGKRHVLAVLLFTGLFIVYELRVCLSVAVVPMAAEFGWSEPTKGLVLSSFFGGYITTQIYGGQLAGTRGKLVFGMGVLLSSLLTAAVPLCASSLPAVIALRVLTGVGEAVTYPAVHALLGRWAPAAARARMCGFIWSGAYVGTMATFPTASALVKVSVPGMGDGWRLIFYGSGAMGVLWWCVWAVLAADTPDSHPTISAAEREYIRRNLPPRLEGVPTPWAELLSHRQVWAIVAQHTTHNWLFYTLLTWLPSFLKQELHYNLKDAGFVSVLPYFACFCFSNVAGNLADALVGAGFKVRTTRCLMQTLAEGVPAMALVACGFLTEKTPVVALVTIAVGVGGSASAGFAANVLDLAPAHAGAILGVSNTVATVPGIVSPYLTGVILGKHPGVAQWRVVFLLAAAITLVGLAAFVLFSRGEYLRMSVPVELPQQHTAHTAHTRRDVRGRHGYGAVGIDKGDGRDRAPPLRVPDAPPPRQ